MIDDRPRPSRQSVIRSHTQDRGDRRAIVLSLIGHGGLILFVFLAGFLLPDPDPILLGSGSGGGSGDFVEVGLVADSSGGEGMYKPAIVPRPAPPPPPPAPAEETEPSVTEEIPEETFVEEAPEETAPTPKPPEPPAKKSEPEAPKRLTRPAEAEHTESTSTTVPREADPGKPGAGGGGLGSGQGQGDRSGVGVGLGSGEGTIDSWYVRQVEKRVAQNWLKTSLGQLGGRVKAIVTFQIRSGGQIIDVRLEESSGRPAVDRAALRAVQAANPLPPLPYEFRRRTVTFQAVFEYPPN